MREESSQQDTERGEDALAQYRVPGAFQPLIGGQFQGVRGITPKQLFHLLSQRFTVDLGVDFIVAHRTEAVQIGRPDGGPLPIDGTGFGMEHISVSKNANSCFQTIGEVPTGEPVNDNVIGDPGDQYLDIDATLCCRFERLEQHPIRHKVGIGESDGVFCAVNGFDVHIANGKVSRSASVPRSLISGSKRRG